MLGAVPFTGPEGHHQLFDSIKNLVLLLWKLLGFEFHCVSVIVVQVHAGKWSDGCSIIDRKASVWTFELFHFIVPWWGDNQDGIYWDSGFAEKQKKRLMVNIMSHNPLQKLIVDPK